MKVAEITSLRECATLGRELATCLPDEPAQRLMIEFWIGEELHELSADSGDADVLAAAVALLFSAAETATRQHELRARVDVAYQLSSALLAQYEDEQGLPTLREAVDESAYALALPDHPAASTFFAHRMTVVHKLAAATNDEQLRREAVQAGRRALAAASADDPNRVSLYFGLCQVLWELHEQTDKREFLWEAVVAARDAEAAAPPNYPDRPELLTKLSSVLLAYYQAQPNSTTLIEAVTAGRNAVEQCPATDSRRDRYLFECGRGLMFFATSTQNRTLMHEAAAIAEQAVDATATTNPQRSTYLNLLGACLFRTFELGGSEKNVDRAIEVLDQAVALLPPKAPERDGLLSNLTAFRRELAARGDRRPGLKKALAEARAAAADSACGHLLANVGFLLQELYDYESTAAILDEAKDALTRAVDAKDLPDHVRIDTYRALAWAHMTAGAFDDALAACERAVALLPGVSSMRLWRRDRQTGLAQTAGLAAEAASTAIAAGRADRAVELLDQTRGTLLVETMDRRGVLADLKAQAPRLAEQYDKLFSLIELMSHNPDEITILKVPGLNATPLSGYAGGRKANFEDETQRDQDWKSTFATIDAQRQQLERTWDSLISRIQQLPGFEDFMTSMSAAAQRRQAADGPIVLINVSRYRGDALLATPSSVRSVRLSGVNRSAITSRVDDLQRAQESLASLSLRARREAQHAITAVLAWLWDNITGPVLDALGYTNSPSPDSWPRVWWCPIGDAAPLPLHAAGHHADGARTVLGRVISSYTPTVRALRYARRMRNADAAQRGALVVATSGTSDTLHSVAAEAHRITKLISGSQLLSDASARVVSDALRDHSLVHFACHGMSDWANPDTSELVLHNDSLTLTQIARSHFPDAHLAYLSACETARTTPRLHDEAIHITSAFQLAGYRHVIGTLWPVDDEASRLIADSFYTTLTYQGTRSPHANLAAYALHTAIRSLRDKYAGNSPSLWAAHIHVGA